MNNNETEDAKSRLRLWLRVMSLSKTVESILREKLRAEYQSTLPRFDVMAALERHPDGLKMSKLSSVLRVSNGNITGLIDRLVDDGYANRSPVPGDRRAHQVSLTKAGLKQFIEMAAAHEVWIDECLRDFPADEAVELSERLRLVTNQIQDAAP